MRPASLLLQLGRSAFDPKLRLRGAVSLAIAEDSASVVLAALAPLLLKAVIDQAQARHTPATTIEMEVLALAAATLAPNVLAGLKQVHLTRVVETLGQALSLRATEAYIARWAEGAAPDLPAALAKLPFALQLVVDGLGFRVVPLVVQLGASLIVLATAVSAREALLLLVTLGLYALAIDVGLKISHREAQSAHTSAARFSQRLGDVLRHPDRVLLNQASKMELGALAPLSERRLQAYRTWARGGAIGTLVQTVVLFAGSALVLCLSMGQVLSGRAGLGDFVLMQTYVLRLALPIGGIAIVLRQAALAFETISEVLAVAGPNPASEAVDLLAHRPDQTGELWCRGVSFSYGDRPLLRDVSFTLPPACFTAVVGANGSGKSTLARLVAGLIEPTAGKIGLFTPAADGSTAAVRRQSSLYVPQFVGLFDRTLADNGLYPPTTLSADALVDHLARWRFHADGRPIDLAQGVGQDGRCLSGGQIQKLELARLTAVDRPCLILDETTSALDPASERAAIATVRAAASCALLLLVTHKPSVAEAADLVIFLDKGEVGGVGPHGRLMQSNARYRAFWQAAQAEFDPNPISGGGHD